MHSIMTKYSEIRNIRVLAFLDAYERQECLWNPSLDSYKNKADRDGAYLEIIKELNIPTLTVHDVKQKVKGIRTTYTKELRLLNKHKEQGKPYKPKLFWFSKANAFLKNVCVQRHKKKFYSKGGDTSAQIEFKDCTIEYISDPASSENEEENEEVMNNLLETVSNHSNRNETPIDFKSFLHTDSRNTKVEDNVDKHSIHQTCSEVEPAMRSLREEETANETFGSPSKSDEFELFCRSVAAQLRSIPDSYSRSVAKLKIQQILFEAETGHYKNTPCITIPIAQQIVE